MKYTGEEVIQYTQEEDVKFIRLAFCDVFGHQKNISVMPDELAHAFEYGVAIDASGVAGFGGAKAQDLRLRPEPDTLTPLPWRPEHGRVVQMFTDITLPDGTPFPCDTRRLLKTAVAKAEAAGFRFRFGAKQDFYLFLLDENGNRTRTPNDEAGYMDIAPDDRGENIRREICLTLDSMGVRPMSSHHEEGPGQNGIYIHSSDALFASDNIQTFRRVIKLVADRNGLYADISRKPLENAPENRISLNMYQDTMSDDDFRNAVSGITRYAEQAMEFFRPKDNSSEGVTPVPALVRIPVTNGGMPYAKYIFPFPKANPYLAFSLMIYAALDGIAGRTDDRFPENRVPEELLRAYKE